ncbi:MAG: acetyl-CoA carboxylase carboxyltransferase subunit beta, partial [Pseudomonadota bacterium]
ARLNHLLGEGWERVELPETADDPLKFKDTKRYPDRLRDYRKKTGERDALVVGLGELGGRAAVVAVQNFAFMGGSMGAAIGEGLLTAAQRAVTSRAALIVVTASGGARMQEGILSLMQMPRSTIAVQMVREAGLPYIVVLTNPTTGGVTASYAMLGDVHMAEPGALIGFAGPRVIEQTIREKLPEDFQRAEYLLDKGMIDRVTDRRDMPSELGKILSVLMPPRTAVQDELPAPMEAANDAPEQPQDLPEAAE